MDVQLALIIANVIAAIVVGWLALVILGHALDDAYEQRARELERRVLERRATRSLRFIEPGPYDWEREM